MDILSLIKKRQAVKKYKNKILQRELTERVIEAGRWSPYIFGIQPWKFIIIEDKNKIQGLSIIFKKKIEKLDDISKRFIFQASLETLSTASTIIAIYNSEKFSKTICKFNKEYTKKSKAAELSAISAAIQNMILMAESLNIGSSWLDSPLVCEKQINKFLNINIKLVGLLALGYPSQKKRRSKRKSFSETSEYLTT